VIPGFRKQVRKVTNGDGTRRDVTAIWGLKLLTR